MLYNTLLLRIYYNNNNKKNLVILDYAYPKPKIQHLIYIMKSTSIYVPLWPVNASLISGFFLTSG